MQPLVPFIPDSAPFTAEQRAWLNGYLAGLFSRAPIAPHASGAPAAAAAPAIEPLTILFGSQTGTAEGLAKRAAKEAGKRGFAATVLDMSQTDAKRIAGEKNLLVITSTYGDGEPPDNAKSLWSALQSAADLNLAQVNFSVCALGDTNYVQFCKFGKDIDAHLQKLGARRVAERVDCDLDAEANFSAWLDRTLSALCGGSPAAPAPPPISSGAPPASDPVSDSATYSRKNPFPALLLASRRLNAEESAKEVRHVELSLEDSGLVYEAGDALGVFPQNCPEQVADVLALIGCDGEEAVPAPDGSTTSLRHALTTFYDLGKPSPELIASFSPRLVGAGAADPAETPHHVIDVLAAAGEVKRSPAEFVSLLKRLQPRLYSISSSPRAHPGQVHLTVGAVRYDFAGRVRKGVCSTFLADRVVPGQSRIGVFVHRSPGFRPPAEGDTGMIMVGPGTGIAPFRGFLHERKARGARGKNWLFFGDQRAASDFLYRDELLAFHTEGLLTRLDTAFSRDQAEKVYVQHRMLEHAAELYAWLEAGAHFYVCGDASRMAKDVDAALQQVVQKAGGKTAAEAAAYVDRLRTTKRYARDVY